MIECSAVMAYVAPAVGVTSMLFGIAFIVGAGSTLMEGAWWHRIIAVLIGLFLQAYGVLVLIDHVIQCWR